MPKPIEDIKEDLQSVIFSVNKLQLDFKELKEINKEMIIRLDNYFKDIDKYNKPIVDKKGWFY